MNRHRNAAWCVISVSSLLIGASVLAQPIDLVELVKETQITTATPTEMTLVWWIPEEFWKASFAQSPGMTPVQSDELLKILRSYTMVSVATGDVGPTGGITYKSGDWVRANARLIDTEGIGVAPKTDDEIDADAKNLVQMFTPIMANMIGALGQNMHILLFPAKTTAGAKFASATERGEVKVKLGAKEFKWRLPLDCLVPAKTCAGCGQECKGSWSFCPWCGKNLTPEKK